MKERKKQSVGEVLYGSERELTDKELLRLCHRVSQMHEAGVSTDLLAAAVREAVLAKGHGILTFTENWARSKSGDSKTEMIKLIEARVGEGTELLITLDDVQKRSERLTENLMNFKSALREAIKEKFKDRGGIEGFGHSLGFKTASIYRFLNEDRTPQYAKVKLIFSGLGIRQIRVRRS